MKNLGILFLFFAMMLTITRCRQLQAAPTTITVGQRMLDLKPLNDTHQIVTVSSRTDTLVCTAPTKSLIRDTVDKSKFILKLENPLSQCTSTQTDYE
ncbi:unnamed protein product [Allacma fusca]|uniref:Uncharacterized protein n=1 Tax=Allacma fusca TaxID=39272 RepID=A0A8J2PX27_9HEXA|nr:unnamed protein product [Allacma fusca]